MALWYWKFQLKIVSCLKTWFCEELCAVIMFHAYGMMEAPVCCQPQDVCGSGVADVWNMSECCTVAGWLMGGTMAGQWSDLQTVVWHLWMAWYKRSYVRPCVRLLQEQTCSLWCDDKQCHHGGFVNGRHWHIELGLTYCSECCMEKCLSQVCGGELWWDLLTSKLHVTWRVTWTAGAGKHGCAEVTQWWIVPCQKDWLIRWAVHR